MGRPKDEQYWKNVRQLEDGTLQCKHCAHEFSGGVSRIKAHVDRIQGKGIRPCSNTNNGPNNEGVDNNTAASSSNPQGVANEMNSLEVAGGVHSNNSGSRNHQNDTELIYPWEGWRSELIAFQLPKKKKENEIGWALLEDVTGSGNSGFESEIKELFDKLRHEEDDVMGELQRLESRGKKRNRQVDDWFNGALELKERARILLDLIESLGTQSRSALEDLRKDVQTHTEEKPLVLLNEIVGLSFETNVEKMLKLLEDDQVFIIGIHGMGGVGKTFLVTQIKNQISRKETFKHVFWVTVSNKFSIQKLQSHIAKRIGVKLDEDDERIRAEMLSSALEEKEKSVLILDDVWNYIDLEKVGIPLRVNGIKLILTTRLKHVCQQMDCPPNNTIQMETLDEDEAWELFSLKLGYHGTPATLDPEVEEIARSVADECDGLPLVINVMTRTMKGVNDIHGWRHSLNKLRSSEMEEEVFKVLKLGYDHLMDKNIQNCFLRCALLYDEIERDGLIMNFVDEELINGMRSFEEIFDEGHTILDKLIDHSLLLEAVCPSLCPRIRMHGLVRDMACNILKERGGYMVKVDKALGKIPPMQEWTAELEKVSLAGNEIEEIPEGTSPQCPRLSTLILSHNPLNCIPDCFFSHMNALAVLDLSYNRKIVFLPDSMSNLTSLKSLLLRRCNSLEHVPPLGQLQALSRLVISFTLIKQVPQGLEMLINLKWLDLSANYNLTLGPECVLRGLTNMKYLDLRCSVGSNVEVNVEDVHGMKMLEYLAGSFRNCNNYNDYVRNTLDMGCGPKGYHLHLGTGHRSVWDFLCGRCVILDGRLISFGDCEELDNLLPRDLKQLWIADNEQWRCLCDALSFKFNGSSSLSYISIEGCTKLESLFCLSGSCSFCTHLLNIGYLYLERLESLNVIWKENDEHMPQFMPPGGMFSHLKYLRVFECHKMEKLLTAGSLPQLPNLVEISVETCNSMKEIFEESSFSEDDDSRTLITIPKLTRLEFINLPQLKSVCRGILVCGSSKVLNIESCPNLERCPTVQDYKYKVISHPDFDFQEAY